MVPANINALGVVCFDNKIFICYQTPKNKITEFNLDFSHDGEKFNHMVQDARISDGEILTDLSRVCSFRISKIGESYRLLFQEKVHGKCYSNNATSNDMSNWILNGRLFPITDAAVELPFFSYKGKEVIFTGGETLNVALSSDSKNWNIYPLDVPKGNYIMGNVNETHEGPLLVYFLKTIHDNHSHYSIWSVLLDKNDPTKVLWQTNKALWYAPQEWINKDVQPVGIVEHDGLLKSYWNYPEIGIFMVKHDGIFEYVENRSPLPHAKLIKNINNPILLPHPDRKWENKQVFNPAAVLHDDKVHLLYRAVGDGDMSVLGYATSSDGHNVDKRYNEPAYVPREKFEFTKTFGVNSFFSKYMSGGGGYGGIEDPRITKIDGKFYLTYVAYDGNSPPRVAMSYITISDFDNKNWKKWSKPVLLSPPGVVDKNAAILPEKIDGKYVIFHRIYPDILIDEVDSLDDFDGKKVWLKGMKKIHPRPNFWDSNKVGIGPPPIKTKDGWLAIYQGVGFQDNSRYKIGAMLLDLKDPSKVLYRSTHPILEPEEYYENEGFKSGVVYPCGAVILGETLIVYYGGSDTFIAAASANLNDFLDNLKIDNMPHVDPISLGDLPTYVETE